MNDADIAQGFEIANSAGLLQQEREIAEAESINNSLGSLCENITGFGGGGNSGFGNFGTQLSQTDTLFLNNRWYLISNLRQLLSQLYVEHGIVQTLIDQPVDDAFRAGFELKSGELSGEELELLMLYAERWGVISGAAGGIKWARLYGGGGVMLITDQDPKTPLNIKAIRQNSPLEFRACDMWELYYDQQNIPGVMEPGTGLGANTGDFYNYYGHPVHKSRVFRIDGKAPPAFIRPRLRGWGMSELERLVRSLNQYMKNQDVIFELLDEAKVDVYKIKGMNSALLNKGGTNKLAERIGHANAIKNFQHAITMDAEDDYAQKQITFTGLAEVLTQIRQGIAADLKMPITKLFGVSAAGFNSGEDDIENYNSMIEGEIRSKNKYIVLDLMAIVSQKLFGYVPKDMQLIWNPLRILNAKEEEEVKDSQFNRVMSGYNAGLASAQEAKQAMNKDSLLGVEVDEESDALPPPNGGDEDDVDPASGTGGKQTPKQS